MKHLALVLLLLMIAVPGSALAQQQEDDDSVSLTREELENAAYPSFYPLEGVAPLTDGEYRERYDPDAATELVITLGDTITYGDLNGDGLEDAAVILVTDPGGSGTFYDVAVVLNEDGAPGNIATKFLGDRVDINAMVLDGTEIVVEMLVQGPEDPMAEPSVLVSQRYTLQDGQLVQVGPLFPYAQDGETYGYVDLSGEFIIAPQFNFADDFFEGRAAVLVDGLYGYIDDTGAFVVEPQFDFASRFSEGLASVVIDTQTGYINLDGDIVVEPQFEYGGPFSEGLATVSHNDETFFIDDTGAEVFRVEADFAMDFSDGLAVIVQEGQTGYINADGDIVIAPQFDFADSFSEGLASVSIDGQNGYINPDGDIVIEPQFDFAAPFSEGLAAIGLDGQTGYINPNGEMVIPPQFDYGASFSEGLAAVGINGQTGYINPTGEVVIAPQYTSGGEFNAGIAYAQVEGLWGYIDQTGRWLFLLPMPVSATQSLPTTVLPFIPDVPAETQAGSCFTTSLVVPDIGYRCFIGENLLSDPCLVATDGETLVCGADPSTGEPGVALDLTEPLPERPVEVDEESEEDTRLPLVALQNATYQFEFLSEGPITLVNGVYEATNEDAGTQLLVSIGDDVGYGDLNDDGIEDTVVELNVNTGGTDTIVELAVVINQEMVPTHVASLPLGDRVVINRLAIDDHQTILVDMVAHRPNDPLCCPSLPLELRYTLEDGQLIQQGELPWLLTLESGAVCNLNTGGTFLINEERANYACDDGTWIGGQVFPGVTWTAEVATIEPSDDGPPTVVESRFVNVFTVWQPADPLDLVREIGLSPADVSLDAGDLAESIRIEIRPGRVYDRNIPPLLNGLPPHLRVAFDDDFIGEFLNPRERQILIYPFTEFQEIYDFAGVVAFDERIAQLQTLLEERPAIVDGTIPTLTDFNAAQTLRAKLKYLDFAGGSGVRFLAHYSQSVDPIINDTIFYTFHGLSSDGEYYLAAFFPITTELLPDTYEDAFAGGDDVYIYQSVPDYESYLADTTDLLNNAASDDFDPVLSDLDALLESLELTLD